MVQQIKSLNETSLNRLQALENRMGCCIVAIESGSAAIDFRPGKSSEPASISEEQLAEIQEMEKELSSLLIAYKC